MAQTITSAGTSVHQVAQVFKKVKWVPGTLNADIGGGKYDDATNYMKSLGVENVVLDPYNRDINHNLTAMNRTGIHQSDTATVANVLNVINDDEDMEYVLIWARGCLKEGGKAYICVYEGNKSGIPKITPKGYQRNQPTAWYLPIIRKFFKTVTLKGKIITAIP